MVHARAFTHEHLLDLLVGVTALMADQCFKLLVIDSICAPFRQGCKLSPLFGFRIGLG